MSNSSSAFPTATPIVFTPALLSTLDSSTESSITRSQYKEQALQKQVSAKLDSLLKEEQSQINKSIESSLLSSSSKDDDKILGSPELNKKLTNIHESLKQSAEAKIAKSDDLLKVEEEVNKCLLQNKGKPLNCWDIVQKFKQIAGNP